MEVAKGLRRGNIVKVKGFDLEQLVLLPCAQDLEHAVVGLWLGKGWSYDEVWAAAAESAKIIEIADITRVRKVAR